MDWTLAIPVIAGCIRNWAGWLENSLKDQKIDAYEWGQLGKTIVEVVVLSVAAMYGFGIGIAEASGVGVLASFAISAIKKIGK